MTPLRRASLTPAAIVLASTGALAGESLVDLLDRHDSCLHNRLLQTEHAAATADAQWDAQTGADARAYPPDRLADFERMVLKIDIEDMNDLTAQAHQTLTFAPIARPLTMLTLEAVDLDIDSVTMNGRDLSYAYDDETLDITFDPPLPAGQTASIKIEYAFTNPVDGLFWSPELPDWEDGPRAAQIHTQGQPETNSYWFPAHDSPNERLATELIVTVPDPYIVSGNGRLASQESRAGRTTFHWVQDKPHVNYLVSLIVGQFDVVDVARPGSDLPLPVYVPKGLGDQVEQTYGMTADMIDAMSKAWDEPYPWDRYAQLVVWNFLAGGMENTSATTMYDTAIFDAKSLQDSDLEGLISHELGHQWFGDLITCNSWSDIWLNEGFATYTESIWFEASDGYDAGYLYDTWRNMRGVSRRDVVRSEKDATRPGMVSREYESPNDVFRKTSNPYSKGASTLHMLRVKLGDETFFKGLAEYVDRFKLDTVETADFRKVMEDVSGLSLERFFEQWAHRPGTPDLKVRAKWSQSDSTLNLTVEQTQYVGPLAPAFAFELPVYIEAGGESQTVVISVDGTKHERSVELPEEPTMVAIDPYLHVLMGAPEVDQPASRFVAQLRHGPTIPSRLDAAAALAEHDDEETVEALTATLSDSSEFFAVRQEAAETLGKLRERTILADALRANHADARVRRSIVRALAGIQNKEDLPLLAQIAANQSESYAVRSSALGAVGEMGSRDHLDILLDAVDHDSQHDQVRRAALSALADLDEPEGLDAALRFVSENFPARTRPTAISAVGDLAHHDKEKAYDAIAPLLYDRYERARYAAAAALVDIEDERGVAYLRNAAETHRVETLRDYCERSANRLSGRLSAEDLDETKEELGRITKELDDLKRKFEDLEKK